MGVKEVADNSLLASLPKICTPARLISSGWWNVTHGCKVTTQQADSISLHLLLYCAAYLHVDTKQAR